MNFIIVFVGGGLGAMLRYAISKITPAPDNGFPLATFLTNMLACLIVGMLIACIGEKSLSYKSQLLFITGFCGGFSTFSTFSAETLQLYSSGSSGMALFYIGSSVIVSLVCIYLGMKFVGA